jgi:hypothetical protein
MLLCPVSMPVSSVHLNESFKNQTFVEIQTRVNISGSRDLSGHESNIEQTCMRIFLIFSSSETSKILTG